jgi:hypothetical protein
MIKHTLELLIAVLLFCAGISIMAWLVTKFGNFVAVAFKIRDKED